ncbi:MAG TPA: fused MFS/spermidine synthase [Usitatibacter sp.]
MTSSKTPIVIREESGVRYLHFGSEWVQGAMRISRPSALELEYTRELMAPLLLRPAASWPGRVLQIGLGSASITRFLHRHRPRARFTIVEIAPEVVAAARQFFKLPDDPKRVRIEIADGSDYVATSGASFDLLVVDGFDERGRTGMLDTLPFYVNCRARLSHAGLFVVNLVDRSRGSVAASSVRLREAFDGRVLVLPPGNDGNTIALAAAGDTATATLALLQERAATLRAQTGLDLRPTLARLAAAKGSTALRLGEPLVL